MNFNKDNKEYTNDWFDHQLAFFQNFLSQYKDKEVNFLEIGSWEGRSTCWMLDNILTNTKSKITCIDSWGGGWEHQDLDMRKVEERFLSNIKENSHKVEVIKSSSKDGLISIQNRKNYYDFIYVDAGHTMLDVIQDGILSFDLLKSEGILAFDDYGWSLDQEVHLIPKLGIDSLLIAWKDKYNIIAKNYQVWITKK